MILPEFSRTISPDTVLTRRRVVPQVTQTGDEQVLTDIVSGELSHTEIEARGGTIAQRLTGAPTEKMSFGQGAGFARVPYVIIELNGSTSSQNHAPWKKVRVKYGHPREIRHNLQHILFLNEAEEAGWTPAVAYGSRPEDPLWICMVNGTGNMAHALAAEEDPLNPTQLLRLWEFMAQYGTKQNHRAYPIQVEHYLLLVGGRLRYRIANSSTLSSERKDYWTNKVDAGIEHLLKDVRRGDEVATWVLADPDPRNFTNLVNGSPIRIGTGEDRREVPYWITVFDQGWPETVINDWRQRCAESPQPQEAFLGRIEHNAGQLGAHIQLMPDVDGRLKNYIVNWLETLATGKFTVPWPQNRPDGIIRSYSLPGPHNQDLSKGLISLGVVDVLLTKMAYEGEISGLPAVTGRVLDALLTNNPYFAVHRDLANLGA